MHIRTALASRTSTPDTKTQPEKLKEKSNAQRARRKSKSAKKAWVWRASCKGVLTQTGRALLARS